VQAQFAVFLAPALVSQHTDGAGLVTYRFCVVRKRSPVIKGLRIQVRFRNNLAAGYINGHQGLRYVSSHWDRNTHPVPDITTATF